jgi:enterochelin esterase family protein
MNSLLLPLLFAVLPLAALAETPPPARTMMSDAPASPLILPDGRVTFRCRAPQAREVKVSGQFGKEALMEKADDGWWTVTIGPAPAGVHEYHFTVDGMNIIDHLNPMVKPQRNPGSSILHIPANPPAPWDLQDIPHGAVSEYSYPSKALGKPRRLMVYSPPGYRSDGPALPVLYLAHGFSDNDQAWSVHGKAHWILDHLIAEKKAVPMLVVMPDAHALPPGAGWKDEYEDQNTKDFCAELTTDVIPLIESTYHVNPAPSARAFAGLSMGGRHAITVALTLSPQFSAVGAFSSAVPAENLIGSAFTDVPGLNSRLKLFWIACGKDDFLFNANNSFDALLKEKGITHEYAVTEGNHSWPVWRNYLTTFVPRLFK